MTRIPFRYSSTLYDELWIPKEALDARNRVRAFCEERIRPVAHDLNNTPESVEAFPRKLVKDMAAAGLFRIPFEKNHGGHGLASPTLATMLMLEEVAYLSPGLAAAMVDVQLLLFGFTLKHAKPDVKAKLFPALMSGEIIGSFATSEPAASTDLSVRALQTEARRVSGGYELRGHKRWITNSPVADYVFVLAKLDGALTMFLVNLKDEGVRVGAPDAKMGNLCQLTADIELDGVFVPDVHLVGTEGRGLKAALASLTLGRIGIAACGVGMAQAAFDYAVDFMKERHVFGKPLAQFQYWQYKFADYATQLETARNLYVKAALANDQQRPSVPHLGAMAKLTGSSLAVELARDAIQVCGGYGFVKRLSNTGEQYPLEAIYRDSKVGEIYEGANEVQKLIVARQIFGRGE